MASIICLLLILPSTQDCLLKSHLLFSLILFIMRIFFVSVVVLLGANLAVDLMDSNMVQLLQDRNETIQRTLNNN